jgi:Tfp pilus assembly protein PilO
MAKKLKKREKLFLLSGGAALLLFVFIKWVALPVARFASEAPERMQTQAAVLQAYEAVVAREESLKKESAAINKTLAKMDGLLLPGETGPLAAAALQTAVKEIAQQAGLEIVSEKVLKQKDREYFVEIPFQIVAKGSIENFRDFMTAVENAEMHIGVSDVNLRALGRRSTRGAQAKSSKGIQATMTVAGLVSAREG